MADCAATLANIEKACGGGNAAGLTTKLQLAWIDDVATIPARDNYPTTGAPHTISGNITMASGKTFKEWNFSESDQEYSVVPEGDDEFITFLTTLKVRIPKVSPLTSYILNGGIGAQYVVINKDKNKRQYINGDKDQGMSFRPEMTVVEKNSYVVTFQLRSKEMPLFYTGTIPV